MNETKPPVVPLFARNASSASPTVRTHVRAGEARGKADERLGKDGG